MPDKILVRKNEEGATLVFVPTISAAKGFVKLWREGTSYDEVKLSVYEATQPADAEETHRKAQEYTESTGRKAKVGERMPRNYQRDELEPIVSQGEPGAYEALLDPEGFWNIFDSRGVRVSVCTTEEAMKRRLRQLTMPTPQ